MPVQHVVLFRFPQELGDAEAATMRAMVAAWPERIGGFTRLRFGTDLNAGERARGYQFLLHTEHDSVEEMRRYQKDPVHLAFAEWVYSRGCEVLAFDYELTAATCLVAESGGTTEEEA